MRERGAEDGDLRGALVGFGFIAERGHAAAYASRTAPLHIVAVAERHAAIAAALPRARIYRDHGTGRRHGHRGDFGRPAVRGSGRDGGCAVVPAGSIDRAVRMMGFASTEARPAGLRRHE